MLKSTLLERMIAIMLRYRPKVTAFQTSPDGRFMVTGHEGGYVCVRNCTTGGLLCDSYDNALYEEVTGLAMYNDSDDDLVVVTVHYKWVVRCWRVDVAARQVRLQWVGHGIREGKEVGIRTTAASVCISNNRRWVAVGGWNYPNGYDGDNDICLFSLRTATETRREPVRMFAGHTDLPCSLCFTPDDRLLVSGGMDLTLRVWSVESGEQLQRFFSFPPVSCMAIRRCADGVDLVSGDINHGLLLWALDHQQFKSPRIASHRHHGSVVALHCTEGGRHAVTLTGR